MTFKAVLFDLDGTLLNTLEDLADAGNAALDDMGFPPHEPEAYKAFVGEGLLMLARRCLPQDHCDADTIERCAALIRNSYLDLWRDKTHPYPGVAEMLSDAHGHGLALSVLSNKPDDFTHKCVEHFLARWHFEVVMGARDDLALKPAADGALEIAQRIGVLPEEFLYVGDTATDMRTACAAGMWGVGALWGFRGAEELRQAGAQVLIEHPTDLLMLL
jgi:phosphoglycolate phosphatase